MRRLNFPQIISSKLLENDDIAIAKYSNWALSNLCRGDVTHKCQRESVAAFIKVLLTFRDEEILKEALLGITDLMDNSMINAFIEAGLIQKLSELA